MEIVGFFLDPTYKLTHSAISKERDSYNYPDTIQDSSYNVSKNQY
jgi:hypothetical protein